MSAPLLDVTCNISHTSSSNFGHSSVLFAFYSLFRNSVKELRDRPEERLGPVGWNLAVLLLRLTLLGSCAVWLTLFLQRSHSGLVDPMIPQIFAFLAANVFHSRCLFNVQGRWHKNHPAGDLILSPSQDPLVVLFHWSVCHLTAFLLQEVAQSVRAVEYTDCFSAEG